VQGVPDGGAGRSACGDDAIVYSKDVQDFPPFETLFETDVSEQRDMPRPPPARALDLEINEREGEIPQHRQTYRAVVHTSQGRKAEYKCI
jgi:hypothetical protein